MDKTAEYRSPLGPLTLSGQDGVLTGLWLAEQKYFGGGAPLGPRAELPIFDGVRQWLDRYFSGKRPDPAELPLAPQGGPFRQEVWKLLLEIPYGQVTTYGAIAQALSARREGQTTSPRAVGSAVGHNPSSIIIPCHRVVGARGNLTGYAGGLERKTWLLNHEGAARRP